MHPTKLRYVASTFASKLSSAIVSQEVACLVLLRARQCFMKSIDGSFDKTHWLSLESDLECDLGSGVDLRIASIVWYRIMVRKYEYS